MTQTKICSKCGIEKPLDDFYRHKTCKFGRFPDCIACHLLYAKQNRPRKNETGRAWKKLNRAKIRASDRAYEAKNKEKLNAWHDRWWKDHPEKAKNKRARHYVAHRSELLKRSLEWQRNNPDVVRERRHKRRAILVGYHTKEQVAQLLVHQDHKCANPFCLCDLMVFKKHLDHVIPLFRGGSNSIDNLQWLCARCNTRKGTLLPIQWAIRMAA